MNITCPSPRCGVTLEYEDIRLFAYKVDFVRYDYSEANTKADMMDYSAKGSMKQILNFDGAQIETVELAKSLKTGVPPLKDDSNF